MPFTGEEIVENDRFVMFWKPPRAVRTVDEVALRDRRHRIHARRAVHDGREGTTVRATRTCSRAILASDDPRTQKKLGQAVKNFDDGLWCERRFDIVVRANLAKFSQSEKLRRLLLATGDKTLVEASPFERHLGHRTARGRPARAETGAVARQEPPRAGADGSENAARRRG